MSTSSDVSSAESVDDAVEAFRRGEPVLVHDAADREGETDLVYPAGSVTPEAVARMRNDAGGLVCVALSDAVSEAFDLPFVQAAVDHPLTDDHQLSYDDRSSFSLTVNHRDTETGITDAERALTITELAAASEDPDAEAFATTFRAPGHVHLLRAASSLAERQGHTELGIALAAAADLPPAVVVCEMLDDESGAELPPAAARAYADRHGLVYVEGAAIAERFA
ncbi:3,4-dihydroxy-2-butanone 4-phosphate synthase [Halomicrobium zhouii]|uniref:3,4-dihydroxy-2-butanone 4-phosphate synthase n=1 Tax=Halomicrobium zhouii TaxID=767519 RepID=A0A1I6KE96_9EURY|nr:3,4-dihydroxy-2-butanone-4-phosphate synthase [Halomicrobium zhouii]SFR89537.1 3,4-dihydroxy-2-butanone 4-phosphate synthase [Halomicrobium zhouii]